MSPNVSINPVGTESAGTPRISANASQDHELAEARLYAAQRDALVGFADTDTGVGVEGVHTMARRWGIEGLLVDVDVTAPTGQAFAFPRLRLLRIHPVAMVRWIVAHEVAHLLAEPERDDESGHGVAFVNRLVEIIGVECGAPARKRLVNALNSNAISFDQDRLPCERKAAH